MTPTFDVLSFGTIALDQILQIPHWPRPDVSTHALTETVALGGKATNTASFLAAWGCSVAVSGTAIGDDSMGDRLIEALSQHPGISTRYLRRIPGLRSMYCLILVHTDGERSIIGVNADSNPQTPPTRDMILDARLLALDLYGGAERVTAARIAFEAGRPVVAGDVRDPQHPVLPYTTLVIASAAEIRASRNLTPREFATAVQGVAPQDVVITQGSADVLVFGKTKETAQISVPSVRVIDSTGAGDAFRAGVIYGLLKGWPLIRNAALGVAAGSWNVQQLGASSHPPTLDELLALADSLSVSPGL